ncbi:MAG TPA: DUF2284 domain-containing protein [Tissierellia bacterium]|nr:DUF2284 domain-containing protein [Tissierellia bacterium]
MYNMKKLTEYIETKDIIYLGDILPSEIIVDEKVRQYCKDNRCGEYNRNFTCPPDVGKIDDFKNRLKEFNSCIIVLTRHKIINKEDREEYFKPAKNLHKILLDIEKKGKELGFEKSIALIAGNCKICTPCKKMIGYKECPYPELSRPSSESLGIDVIKTVAKKGLEIEFKDDEVTWVGMILI